MQQFRPGRPSPALVISIIALVVAMGGTGYAAFKLPKNSVDSKQIKKNAVTSTKVKNGSLLAGDFKRGQLPSGSPGPIGPKGDKGEKGDNGNDGAPGRDFSITTRLASGETETGGYSVWGGTATGTTGALGTSVNYRVPLAAALNGSHVIFNASGATSSHCSGPGHAATGYLCVYEGQTNHSGAAFFAIYRASGAGDGSDPDGFGLNFSSGSTYAYSYGTWAVTAP